VNPILQLQILNEHQTVEYGPVLFQKTNAELWLPKKAELYLDVHKHHYFRRVSFDHFTLFSVDSEGRVDEVKWKEGSPRPHPHPRNLNSNMATCFEIDAAGRSGLLAAE